MKKILKTFSILVVVLLMGVITISPITALCEEKEKMITPKYDISEKEIKMMECVIQQEVRDGGLEHKILIAQLIINRLNSKKFPNNIEDILSQKGQFTSINNYYNTKYKPNKITKRAVKKVIDGYEDVTFGAVFYFSPIYCTDKSTVSWFRSLDNCLTYTETLNGTKYIHEFYK